MLENLRDIYVRLYRSSAVTPWGFRLQGGAGTSTPLSIQRVFAGGVAEGQLVRGDILVAVDGSDVFEAPHFVAEELIKKAGKELLLKIKRASTVHLSPRNEKHTNYPFEVHGGLEDYEHARNMSEIKQKFNEPVDESGERGRIQINPQPGSTSYLPKRPNFTKSFANQNSPDYGWVPKAREVPDYQSRYRPQHIQQVLSNEEKYHTLPRENIRHEQYEKPAWLGTLRSSGGPKPWEVQDGMTLTGGKQDEQQDRRRHEAPVSTFQVEDATRAVHQPKVQVAKFTNKGFSGFEQRPVNQANSNAKVAHLQYNTPISLYSRENAEEAFRSQTGSFGGNLGPKPWASFDSPQSDVYRLVREEDKKRRGQQHHQPVERRGPHRSARLEHLIHENDDQQTSYKELQRTQVFREKMAVSDF